MKAILLILAVALCGCVSTPTRKAPPLPPTPPGFTKTFARATGARSAFVPDSTAPVGYPAIFIHGWHVVPADPPFFPAQTNVFIACDQPANTVLSVRMNSELVTTPVAGWPEPAQWGCYPYDQLLGMSIAVPGASFFKTNLTPCESALTDRAIPETQTPTEKTVVVRGKTYKLVALKRVGENTRLVQRYRLVPK